MGPGSGRIVDRIKKGLGSRDPPQLNNDIREDRERKDEVKMRESRGGEEGCRK